jgi:hypothetical protein
MSNSNLERGNYFSRLFVRISHSNILFCRIPATNLSLSVSSLFEHILAWVSSDMQEEQMTTTTVNIDDTDENTLDVAAGQDRIVLSSSRRGKARSRSVSSAHASDVSETQYRKLDMSFDDFVEEISRGQHASSELMLISVADLIITTWQAVKRWQLEYLLFPFRSNVLLETGEVMVLEQLPPANSFHILLHRFFAAMIYEASRRPQHITALNQISRLLQAEEEDCLLLLSLASQPLLLSSEVL